ncbi:MAG TPA: UDP-glucose/GDP-mannose dehydrogenase family protein [Bauldia sp.]|nr:UDP-glucose/GDP-mannose dehydrogenase family protein [Bauldia sp.]
MRLTMVGAGYVGLVSGACFAEFGHEVVCVDREAGRIAALEAGHMPIYEPGLDAAVAEGRRTGRLSFSTELAPAVAGSDAVFIAVGTPLGADGRADLSFVHAAAAEVAAALDGFTIVILKSTVPVGTGDEVEAIIREARPQAEFAVVSNPEFLREGAAIDDFKRPDRIVVGTLDPRARAVMTEIYRPLYLQEAPTLFTDRRTAELIKYASNAFLATKITFINEMADLCEQAGANVQDVAIGLGLDHRVGRHFLQAGPGFGGSCLPKDLLALVETGERFGAPQRIARVVTEINTARKAAMAEKIRGALGGDLSGASIALLGLTFKPGTDDMREAPSLALIAALQAAGASVRAYDPQGMERTRKLTTGVTFARDAYDCAAGADVLVLVTEWEEFRALDLERLKAGLARPIVVDLRNVYSPAEMKSAGFVYASVGRPRSDAPGDSR